MGLTLRLIPRDARSLTAATALAVAVLARSVVADQVEWKLVFEDDFERILSNSQFAADWFEPYPGTKAPPTEFAGPRQRILRGGSWDWVEPENQGSARRDRAVPDARRDHYGLRIVVPVDEAPSAARPDVAMTREQ